MEKFHERFGIEVGVEEARRRFFNRAYNQVFDHIDTWSEDNEKIKREIATGLGEKYTPGFTVDYYLKNDFHRALLALECFYWAVDDFVRSSLDETIPGLLAESEVDLGIRWENGRFIPAGAEILDERLVNDQLRWLSKSGYESVLQPFQKGLEHLVHATKRPELLADVITDMYEALEALAKIITGRPDRDLSANRELFITKVKVSEAYKKLLREYVDYANQFRHGAIEGKPKPALSEREVESFIYLTGLFIRLAMDVEK